MILQQCSINGTKYKIGDIGIQEENRPNVLKLHQYSREMVIFFQALSLCHTVQVAHLQQEHQNPEEDEDMEKSFEIVETDISTIDTDTSLVELEDNILRNVETTHNTIQNEICTQDNLLEKPPSGIESKTNSILFY